MLPLGLGLVAGVHRVVALGAHPDDIEIGCGGTLSRLAESVPGLAVDVVVATGAPERLEEARRSVEIFLPRCDVRVRTLGLPDGRLPAYWCEVKDRLEEIAVGIQADVVFTPCLDDAHQDHRTMAELAPTGWRDHLIPAYEIPKYDGDLGRPSVYVPLSEEQMQDKLQRLHKAFPSQAARDWWDDEVFRGLARLRGMECRARYAEAFTVGKV